ncbi:chemotaxis protein CheW [Halostella salina]|uniref:chemotaxis protein CheW n=1 Tax=Halostella salina TaxID=1547897 RepID=UPI000EF77513|nr:chemotaxis protein CheW [Halostella salina]
MSEHRRMLAFDLADERYCVALDRVRNVLDSGTLDPEDASGSVAGRMDVDGESLRVVDLKDLFGATVSVRHSEEIEQGEHVVVFDSRTDGEVDAWLVDEVYDAVSTDIGDVHRPSSPIPHVEGVLHVDGDRAMWIDADSING